MAEQKASVESAADDLESQETTETDAPQAAEGAAENAEQEPGEATAGDDIDGLKQQLADANAEVQNNRDALLRMRADMENMRKRQARELENAHKYGLDKMAMELLPVRDTLELGVAAAQADEAELGKIVEGTELTLKMLTQSLEKFNIVEVDPVGEKFDPDLHQAISVQEGTDKPANTVLNVMQKGYTLNERLLRPAMVVIAK